jgi:hypothetical protein
MLVVLVRAVELAAIRMDFIPQRGYWTINALRSPIIEFRRSYMDDNIIRQGRMYFIPRYLENNQWVDKSPEFVAWADSILRFMRRHLRRLPSIGCYAGGDAAWLLESGQRLYHAGYGTPRRVEPDSRNTEAK